MTTVAVTRRDQQIAGYAALAIAIHILEAAVPSPIPGIKPGLANVIVLLALLRFDMRFAAQVALLRVVVGSLLIGTFFSPTFFLSLAGALGSLAIMITLKSLFRRHIGAVGLAVAASLAHVGAQFLVAWQVFLPHPMLLNLLPLLLTAAFGFGLATGIITQTLHERLPAP